MARKIVLSGYKEGAKGEGKLTFPESARVGVFAKSLGDNVRLILEIREDETDLIKSHRGYYYAVVLKHVAMALRDVCGYMIEPGATEVQEAIHDWCKKEFLTNSVIMKNMSGDSITLPPSTKRLDDEGWKLYLGKIIIFAAEMWGYVIPAKMPKYAFPTEEPEFVRYREIASAM